MSSSQGMKCSLTAVQQRHISAAKESFIRSSVSLPPAGRDGLQFPFWHEYKFFCGAWRHFLSREKGGDCRLNKNLQNGERCEQRERRFTVNIRCRDVGLENIQVKFTLFRKRKSEDDFRLAKYDFFSVQFQTERGERLEQIDLQLRDGRTGKVRDSWTFFDNFFLF